MRPVTKLRGAIAAAALLASCTSLSQESPTGGFEAAGSVSNESRDLLFVERRGGLRAIDAATGEGLFGAPNSFTSPDFSFLYSDVQRADESFVSMLNSGNGKRLGRVRVARNLEPRISSTSGDLLALTEPHKPGATPWLPAGKSRTEISVVQSGEGIARSYHLEGNFEVEAFSTDDRQLFLLEYRPAMNPTRYTLRRLKLGTGEVAPIKRSKQRAPGTMLGTGRTALFSPTGHELYTLYTQQGPNYTHGDTGHSHDKGAIHAFIHLLNLDGAWTHCIDLTMPFGTGPVTTHALAVSADGSRLYVADPSSGGVAVIDPNEAKVLESVTMDLGSLTEGEASAAAGSNGSLYLGGGSEVLVLDGETLEETGRWNMSERVLGVAMGADGSRLYVALRDRVEVRDSTTGARLRTFEARGVRGISHMGSN